MTNLIINYPLFSIFLQLIILIEVYRITQESFIFLSTCILFLGLFFFSRLTNKRSSISGHSYIYNTLTFCTKISPTIYIVFFLVVFSMFFRFAIFSWQQESLNSIIENSSILTAEVISVERKGYVMKHAGITSSRFSFLAAKFIYITDENLTPGDILLFDNPRLENLLQPQKFSGNKSELFINGIKYNIEAANTSYKKPGDMFKDFDQKDNKFTQWRDYLSSQFDNYYSTERANLLKALLLGKRGLNREAERLLRQAGAGHVLALSGLHIGYIALFSSAAVNYIAQVTGIYGIKYISVFLILGYVILAGASPSLLRAGIMSVSWIVLLAVKRPSSTLNILGLAGTLILLINPYNLYQVSFQISFLVVLAIIFYLPGLSRFLPAPLALSISAQFGAQPLLVYLGGVLNLNGLAANLILIPLLGPIIFLNLIFLFAASFNNHVAQLVVYMGDFFLTSFLSLAGVLAELPFIFEASWIADKLSDSLTLDFFIPAPVLCLYIILLLPPFIFRPRPVSWLKKVPIIPLNFAEVLWLIAFLYFIIEILLN